MTRFMVTFRNGIILNGFSADKTIVFVLRTLIPVRIMINNDWCNYLALTSNIYSLFSRSRMPIWAVTSMSTIVVVATISPIEMLRTSNRKGLGSVGHYNY